MEQYISKSALVAKIKKRKKNLYPKGGQGMVVTKILKDHYDDLLSFLDSLEVREVDLEKEIDNFYGMYRKNGITFSIEDNQECLDWKVDCNPNFEKAFAKHFFELGMQVSNKTQKGEKV